MSTSIITNNLSVSEVEGYNTNQLIIYLQSYFQGKKLTLNDSEIRKFHEEDINGYTFPTLTDDFLKQLGFSIGKRSILVDLINNLNKQSKSQILPKHG